jgi:hypothetical protein
MAGPHGGVTRGYAASTPGYCTSDGHAAQRKDARCTQAGFHQVRTQKGCRWKGPQAWR